MTANGTVLIAGNPHATNGTVVGGRELGDQQELPLDELVEAGSSLFAVRTASSDETRRRDRLGQVPFNRVPYRRTVVQPQRFPDLAKPPDAPTKRKLSLAAALSPAVMGVVFAVAMDRYVFLIIAGVSPTLLIYKHFSDRRGGKRSYARERAAFNERVDARAEELGQALAIEHQTRLTAAPDLAELAHQAALHQPRLWERNRIAGDLLHLCLGLGSRPSQVEARIVPGGDDELRAEGDERLAHQQTVYDVPITLELVEMGVVGLWGDPSQVAAVGRALTAQAACLHSPEDVVMVAGIGAANLAGFEWLKWLPHVHRLVTFAEQPGERSRAGRP